MSQRPASRKIDTLEEIRAASFCLFGRYGYDGVSIGDIADATNLSKGALYWHFSGKQELFLDCLRSMHRIFEESVFAPMQRERDPVQRIVRLFKGVSGLLNDPRVVEGIVGYWLVLNKPAMSEAQAVQRQFEHDTARLIGETLEMGVRAGVFDFDDDLEDMSRAMVAIMEAIILPLRHQTTDEAHHILAVIMRSFLRSYASAEVVAAVRDF